MTQNSCAVAMRNAILRNYLKYSIKEGRRRGLWRNVYLLKIEAKSFRDTRQDIGKDTESNLGPFASFKGEIIQKQALFSLPFRTPNIKFTRCFNIEAVCSVFLSFPFLPR